MMLLKAVGEASLSAAVMILAVMALRVRFQDRTPRRAFCLLWDIVLVRLLILGSVASPVSILRWLPRGNAQPAAMSEAPAMVAGVIEGTLVLRDIPVTQVEGITWLVEDTTVAAETAQACFAMDWGAVLTVVWLTAALLLALGFLWSHLRSRKLYAVSLPCRDTFVLDWLAAHPLRRPVQARVSDQISAPLTYGVVYPVILLPRSMDGTDREVLSCVLAHEHTHIRRFDALRKVFLAAALCLHWFNPLVWAMYTLANRDIELACDEAVLRGGADRERYALALLSLEERRGRWSPSGSHFSRNALEERIKAIMKRKHISITAIVAVLVVMCITTTVFASAAPEVKEDANQSENTRNAPETGYVYDHLGLVENDVAIMSKGGEDGELLYSDDGGKTWMDEERYQAKYGSWGDNWQVEWWTYEDYKAWLEEEKAVLQDIIGDQGYTGTRGWFTWDQKMVDETIAMYEEILENIKNGALYSRTIIDKNGNTVEDAMLGSDRPLDMVITSVFDETDRVSIEPKEFDEAALLDELKALGIGGNANLMTYNGELIRTFVDGVSVGENGYSIQFVYTNSEGTVDVHTLRAVTYNPDGSYDPMGELIGVAAKGGQGFDQGLIDCGTFSGSSGPQATHAEGGSTGRGKTFEEIFAQYEEYGLVYLPRESGMGGMNYCGLPVRTFADLKPDGSVFSYEDPYAQEGLSVRAVYDENGKLSGLTADNAPSKPISQEKQELGFAYCAPVQGTLSAGFNQGTLRFHYGVDLAADNGTEIVAFAGGVVSETGFSASKGNYVVISHADGYSTVYAHCSTVLVAEGDSVAMGERIAEVGASGMATGPHLHFELRSGGTYLDPAQYLDLSSMA